MTKLDLLIIQIHYLTVVYSEIPFSKNLYHIETIQLICFANRLTGFYMMQGFTGRYFRIERTRHSVIFKIVQHFNLFTFYMFFFDMQNTVLWLAYRSKGIHNVIWTSACILTFICASKDCIALSKTVFVYNILLEETPSRPLEKS